MRDDRTRQRQRADAAWLLPVERQRRMIELVRTGPVRIAELAAALAVSPMTIRRDADALVQAGALERVRGGVRAVQQPSSWEPAPSTKSKVRPEAKARIAQVVRTLVQPGTSVGIGAGTTTLEVAKALVDIEDLTVVTNAIPVVHALEGSNVHVVVTGGERTPSDALVGPIANQAVAALSLDLLVLGAHAMDVDRGCSTPNLQEAEINRALIGAAATTVIAADASTWGQRGLATFATLDEIAVFVTDRALRTAARDEVERRVATVLYA